MSEWDGEFDFDDGPDTPYQRHSDESREAAGAIEPGAVTLRGQVFACIHKRGVTGATDDEVQVLLDMNPSTQRPRRIELWRAELVHPSGMTRPTRSGRSAMVWVTSEFREALVAIALKKAAAEERLTNDDQRGAA